MRTLLVAALSNAADSKETHQGAFVFAKPHANTPAMRALMRKKFKEVGLHIESEGSISGEAIDAAAASARRERATGGAVPSMLLLEVAMMGSAGRAGSE